MRAISRNFLRERRAMTAVEYGIIAGCLGLTMIGIMQMLDFILAPIFESIGCPAHVVCNIPA